MTKLDKDYQNAFSMPKALKITGRSSTITNVFVSAIIPSIQPTIEEIRKVLEILKLNPLDLKCSYCGDKCSEWDHLRPLVKDKKATGYISSIRNLVPSCGKCNQSKGNKDWKNWMLSSAKYSPKNRCIKGLKERIKRIENFERWANCKPVNIKKIIGKKKIEKYYQALDDIRNEMENAQKIADELNQIIKREFKSRVLNRRCLIIREI